MTQQLIKGIHHVTATVGDAQEDYDFYTHLLGLRLVKKTVNFDNNQVYHFYYGDEVGNPGTIMTTFPYKGHHVREGIIGNGQVMITSFSVPVVSLGFWKNRLKIAEVDTEELTKFDQPVLRFKDPSGLILELIGQDDDARTPWTTEELAEDVAIRGFHSVTLAIAEVGPTFDFLMQEFGFRKLGSEGDTTRFAAHEGGASQLVDVYAGASEEGKNGLGTVHHVAWRVESDEALLAMRARLADELGFKVTEVRDRKYFHSIYFRIPGKVLFEIATIPPGFPLDEEISELGLELKLPDWEEVNRTQIETALPSVKW